MRNHTDVLVVQIDNREAVFYRESKGLVIPRHENRKFAIEAMNGGVIHEHTFWSLSSLVNRLKCRELGWAYDRWVVNQTARHVTWNKVKGFLEKLPFVREGIVLFLDSDAWIRDGAGLAGMLQEFEQSDHFLLFAEDPAIHYNTRINTGCIAMKNDPRTLNFWQDVWEQPDTNSEMARFRHDWAHEQQVADVLLTRAYSGSAMIVPLQDLNSPCGRLVRHCWWKDTVKEMLIDELISIHTSRYFDDEPNHLVPDPPTAPIRVRPA